jgi:hypothetical protein
VRDGNPPPNLDVTVIAFDTKLAITMLHDDKDHEDEDIELTTHGSGPRPERRVPRDSGNGSA